MLVFFLFFFKTSFNRSVAWAHKPEHVSCSPCSRWLRHHQRLGAHRTKQILPASSLDLGLEHDKRCSDRQRRDRWARHVEKYLHCSDPFPLVQTELHALFARTCSLSCYFHRQRILVVVVVVVVAAALSIWRCGYIGGNNNNATCLSEYPGHTLSADGCMACTVPAICTVHACCTVPPQVWSKTQCFAPAGKTGMLRTPLTTGGHGSTNRCFRASCTCRT